MGNSDIRSLAEIETVDTPEVGGWSVCIDASNWLYKYMTVKAKYTKLNYYKRSDGVELANLISIPSGVAKLLEQNIQPIFVFDGKPNQLKEDELDRRREKREQAREKAENTTDEIKRAKYESRSQRLTDEIITTSKELLDILDIPHLTAPEAAEAQGAHMVANNNNINALLSDDYDSVVFGSPVTIRKFTNSDPTVELLRPPNDLSQEQLITATILCGTDYNDGVYGVGPKTAKDNVKNMTRDEIKQKYSDKLTPNFDEIFALYANPNVTDSYPSIKTPTPDVDEAKEYLQQHEIELSEVNSDLSTIETSGGQSSLTSF